MHFVYFIIPVYNTNFYIFRLLMHICSQWWCSSKRILYQPNNLYESQKIYFPFFSLSMIFSLPLQLLVGGKCTFWNCAKLICYKQWKEQNRDLKQIWKKAKFLRLTGREHHTNFRFYRFSSIWNAIKIGWRTKQWWKAKKVKVNLTQRGVTVTPDNQCCSHVNVFLVQGTLKS